ncbi:MAG: hypothetical protein H6817_07300 [Phycisphaerales bacterium]|nr:hypothetical protein [Phycisphaerales bacterium]
MIEPAADIVPEHWTLTGEESPADSAPLRWWRIPFLLAGVIFAPTRLGPRVARTTWRQTIAAHLLTAMLVTVGMCSWVIVQNQSGHLRSWLGAANTNEPNIENVVGVEMHLTISERLRLPIVSLINDLYIGMRDHRDIEFWLLGLVVLHVACWLGALIILPAVARYVRRRRYLRCVKLGIWASVCAVPISFAVAVAILVVDTWLAEYQSDLDDILPVIVGIVLQTWWCILIIKLGMRPATPEEALEGSRAAIFCYGCGYHLIGLPLGGNCPECGREIATSMPSTRRLPPWAQARGIARLRAWRNTAMDAATRMEFYRGLAVDRSAERAMSFAAVNALIAGLVCGTTSVFVPAIRDRYSESFAELASAAVLLTLVVAVALVWCMLGLLLVMRFSCRRSPSATLIAACYSSAWLPPAACVTMFAIHVPGIGLGWISSQIEHSMVLFTIKSLHAQVTLLHLFVFAWVVVIVLPVALGIRQTVRAIREMRFVGI